MTTKPESAQGNWHDSEIAKHVDSVIVQAGLDQLPSLAAIIERVAALHHKPIRLEQVGDAEWGTLTGLWIETPELSRIFTRRTDPIAYQIVCALHEVMHILLEHPSCLPSTDHDSRLPPDTQRARAAGKASNTSPGQAIHETEAEYGARVLAQSLLREVEDSVERRFG